MLELRFLGRAGQRGGRGLAALDGLRDGVEVAGAHFALVLDRGEAQVGGGEFLLLQFDEGAHLAPGVAVGQFEHAVVQRVEAGQRDELELVAHGAQLALELGDGGVVQVLLPVERRRAVVRQQLARELAMDRVGELAGVFQVGRGGFAPDQVGVRRVGQAARDRLVDAGAGAEEAFHGALAGDERAVVVVDVAGHQVGGVGVGAGQQHGGRAHHVGRQARRDQLGHGLAGRHQHLAAHVAALLHGRQLILEVHARSAGLDHGLHQFEGVQHAAETGFGIGHDGREEVDVAFVARVLAFHPLDLVAAGQRIVDAAHDLRHRIGGVQRLVGVHLAGQVGVAGHLPARQVDGLEAGLDLLHGLVAGQGAERIHERLAVQLFPQAGRAAAGQGVLDGDRAAQADDILGAVVALDALPAAVLGPVFLQIADFGFAVAHGHAPWSMAEKARKLRGCIA
ncbi:Uncharacterised protein [Achromobacter xylosoxidans]|nr:Uncharacterised protein [Achromobacter xylosoxidans]